MPRLTVTHASSTLVRIGGRDVVLFGGCNYLGLAHHPAVLAAAKGGLDRYGLSTSASRETTGNTTAHDELEAALAEFLTAPAVIVTPDGFTANLAAASALAPDHRTALVDSRAHASILEAARASGMCIETYAHRGAAAAAAISRLHAGSGVVIWTDGVFATDGSLAPIAELLAALPPGRATLVVDDCHGVGAIGPGARGTLAQLEIRDPRVILTGTLAKGIGCHGGFISGGAEIVARVRAASPAYIGTTPVSPAIACAAKEALAVIDREPQRLERLKSNTHRLRTGLSRLGLAAGASTVPVFAFTLASEGRMEALHESLLRDGFLAPLIRYPGGPAPVYFRLSVSSEHAAGQIDGLVEALARGTG